MLIETIGRTLDDGGWTPATITVTGTDITVSGYTTTFPYTGFISVSGYVTELVVNSEEHTATINGINMNSRIINKDYELYVGPGLTFFVVDGASSFHIEYQNRWSL